MLRKSKMMGPTIHKEKASDYKIFCKTCNDELKQRKLLETLVDTKNDVKRTKGLAVNAAIKLYQISKNVKLSHMIKKVFQCCTTSIFLYDSETQTVKKNNKQVRSFHECLIQTLVLKIN